MIKRVLGRITDDLLIQGIENASDAQKVLFFCEVNRADALGEKSQQFVSNVTEEHKYLSDKKELSFLKIKVPAIKEMINSVDANDPEIPSMKHNLYTKSRRLERLEKELEGSELTDVFKDIITFSKSEEYVELYDALAQRVGKWFEEGHAGPGTINYNGHTFTSKVS